MIGTIGVDWGLFDQMLNGVQLGVLLFLLAAGLTLVFGIMDFVNLAHGSLYMMGAYFCATLVQLTESFILGVILALPLTALLGWLVELIVVRALYTHDHLDHVLADRIDPLFRYGCRFHMGADRHDYTVLTFA